MNAHAQLRQLSIGTPSGNWGEMTCSKGPRAGLEPATTATEAGANMVRTLYPLRHRSTQQLIFYGTVMQ